VVFYSFFLYFFMFWMSWLWRLICLLWVRVSNVDVCVEVAIWLTVVQSWVVSCFLFRYGVEERLFCVVGGMNEGVVKLFRRDAVVKDGGDDTLAAFRIWMVVRVSDLGKRLKMMMWHTVVGADVYTRIMATCHAIIGQENTFFLNLRCTLDLSSL